MNVYAGEKNVVEPTGMKTSVTTVKVNGVPGYTTYRLARPDSHSPQPSYSTAARRIALCTARSAWCTQS